MLLRVKKRRSDEEHFFDRVKVFSDILSGEKSTHGMRYYNSGFLNAKLFHSFDDGANMVFCTVLRPLRGRRVAETEKVETYETNIVEFWLRLDIFDYIFP